MARIQYTTYGFNKPNEIGQVDFDILKEVLSTNPQHSINPSSNFFETFNFELKVIAAAIIGLFIASFDIQVLNWIGILAALFGFGMLFSFVPSAISYLEFMSEKASYYSQLKSDILQSKDYEEFKNKRIKRR